MRHARARCGPLKGDPATLLHAQVSSSFGLVAVYCLLGSAQEYLVITYITIILHGTSPFGLGTARRPAEARGGQVRGLFVIHRSSPKFTKPCLRNFIYAASK